MLFTHQSWLLGPLENFQRTSLGRCVPAGLIPFSVINNILISVKRSNFTLVFYKAACHDNPGAVILQDQAYIFQDTYF